MSAHVFLRCASLLLGISFLSATVCAQETATAASVTIDEPASALLRGPYLQVATSTSIEIRWRTDTASSSRVQYGTEPGKLNKAVDDPALVTEHKVTLTGLQPHQEYYYAIGSLNATLQGGEDDYFMTLPKPGSTGLLRIGVFGDCGTNLVNQHQVKESFLKYLGKNYMDAWILLGDNAYDRGTDAEFQAKFFNVYKNDLLKKYPLFPSPGNHDYSGVDFKTAANPSQMHNMAYYQIFSTPVHGEAGGVASNSQAYYSYDIGNVHFLSLDSHGKEDNMFRMSDTLGPQVQWIKKDLEANKNKGWIIAYWHHPPFTMGSHNSDKEDQLVQIRQNFIRILERYGVDLIICGHSHDYERSRLMKGYYGNEEAFNESYNLSASSGLNDGSPSSEPYVKEGPDTPGTIYVVTGSAGKIDQSPQTTFPHNAMYFSDHEHGGASILEIEGKKLELKWICADGVIRDHFTMMKKK